MKVLLVDDSTTSLDLLERSFKSAGWETNSAKDGLEAWEIAQRLDSLDVVVSDYNMPGLNGLELAQKLDSSNHKGVLFFLLTSVGIESEELIEIAREVGVKAWIAKPLQDRHIQIIHKALKEK